MNNSPWIHQLTFKRAHPRLTADADADVVIVGGGIAGIATAFFVLRDTRRSVILLEGNKIAHGATGHNAGQLVSYFEYPFSDLVNKYGLTLAIQAQEGVLSAWDLLAEMYTVADLKTPLSRFTGYAGCSTVEQINSHLLNLTYQKQGGLDFEKIMVADIPEVLARIPAEYADLYAVVPLEKILSVLETDNREYLAALSSLKGCLNSALFCEEVLEYLIEHYPSRLRVFEQAWVKEVLLGKKSAALSVAGGHLVRSDRVILCTNGFENFKITNTTGPDINGKFHELVMGQIGYMAGFLDPRPLPPTGVSYFPAKAADGKKKTLAEAEPYFYLTRRHYEHKEHGHQVLTCIGGPEESLPDRAAYDANKKFSPKARREIVAFLKKEYTKLNGHTTGPLFEWHGLMGYTKSGVRCIGPDPCNQTLIYNLGCNGIGILPSIYGGKRVAKFLGYKKLEKSIFDPFDQTCLLT